MQSPVRCCCSRSATGAAASSSAATLAAASSLTCRLGRKKISNAAPFSSSSSPLRRPLFRSGSRFLLMAMRSTSDLGSAENQDHGEGFSSHPESGEEPSSPPSLPSERRRRRRPTPLEAALAAAEEAAEALAPSSSSSGVARGRELRGRKCCLLAGARGRKRAEEEEEGRGAAAAAAARGERRRSRSRPPTPPTADADDGDGAPRIVAPAATPSLLPRPEKPGADEAPAGSVQQAARIPAEQRRGEGARALLFSSLNGEREKDSGTAWRERGQKQCLPKTLTTKAKKEKEERLLLPFSSYPFYCEMSAARAMVVSRAGCVSS